MKRYLILFSVLVVTGLGPQWGYSCCGGESTLPERKLPACSTCYVEDAQGPRECCRKSKGCCDCCSRCNRSQCGCAYGHCRCNERPTTPPAAPRSGSERLTERLSQGLPSTHTGLALGSPMDDTVCGDLCQELVRFLVPPRYLTNHSFRC